MFSHQPAPYQHHTPSSACKGLIRRLLHKDEGRRLGSRAGASDIKAHPFFKTVNFALLRHETPPIVPLIQMPNGIDALNFRKMPPESFSLDLETDINATRIKTNDLHQTNDINPAIKDVACTNVNPFEKFNSSKCVCVCVCVSMGMLISHLSLSLSLFVVTLYHEGDSDSEFDQF
jgi:hypothetical protein